MPDHPNAALEDVRVLDLTTGVAGPMAAMLLADFGADVVKIEPPGGDRDRSRPRFPMFNRGKRSVVLDAMTDAGRDRIAELVASADVVLLGASGPFVDAVDAVPIDVNPGLVRVAVTPFLDGTPWVGEHESAGLLWAHVGAALRQSSLDGGPVDPAFPYVLYNQGIWAAGVAVTALVERQRSGHGQSVTVGGLHGSMITSTMTMVIDRTVPETPAANGPGGPNPMYTRYQCGDGEWVFMATLLPKFQHRALPLLGLEYLLDDERLPDLAAMSTPENRRWVRPLFDAAFATQPSEHWLRTFADADIPIGPVCSRDKWLDSSPIRELGMRIEVQDPERGLVVTPGNPLTLTATPANPTRSAPRIGEHDRDLDWKPRPVVDGIPGTEPPLAGLRVLDLGAVLAGPFAGTLLADLGADVIKVEVPVGDSWRAAGMSVIRGQRGLAIDLRADAGREAFYRLVAAADVVIDNYRVGVLDRLQIDDAHLRAINPSIITMSVNAYGEDSELATAPAFDPLLQARSGIMLAQGSSQDPVCLTVALNDVTSAALTVLGTVVATYHRGRTGEGQRGWVTLAGASAFVQSEELIQVTGREHPTAGGQNYRGPNALDRFYATSDGWVRIEADPQLGVDQLRDVFGGEHDGHREDDTELTARLTQAFAELTRADALQRLHDAGVPAAAARRMHEIAEDPQYVEWAVFAELDRPDNDVPLLVPGRYAAFSRTPARQSMRPPGVGEHTEAILAEADFTPAEIDGLLAEGVVRQGEAMVPQSFAAYR